MPLEELAQELLNLIFQNLPRQDLKQCLSVCNAFFAIAAQSYYSQVDIMDKNIEAIQKLVENEQQGRLLRVGTFVQRLKISTFEVGYENALSNLLAHLPNLRVIHLNAHDTRFSNFANLLNQAIQNQHLQRVTEITDNYFRSGQATMDYLSVCYKLRASITSLTLRRLYLKYTIDDKIGDSLAFLPDFPRLTHLTVQNSYLTVEHAESFVLLYTPLELCPKLSSYIFQSTYSLTDDVIGKQKAKPVEHTRLKWLVVNVPILPRAYIKYMCQCLPSLTSLHLTITDMDHDMEKFIQDQTTQAWAQYLSKLISCKLVFRSRKVAPVNTLEGVHHMWKFIDMLRGSRQLHCNLRFDLLDRHIHKSYGWFEVEIKNNQMDIHFYLKANITLCTIDSILAFFAPPAASDVPSLVRCVHLNIGEASFELDTENIIKRYRQLNRLMITRDRRTYLVDLQSPHLKADIIKKDDIVKKEDTTKEEDCVHTKALQERFTQAYFNQQTLSPDFMQMLNRDIPCTQKLTFSHCLLEFDQNINASIDLCRLQGLKLLHLQLDNLKVVELARFYIIVLSSDGWCGYRSERVKYSTVGQGKSRTATFELIPIDKHYLYSYDRIQSRRASIVYIRVQTVQNLTIQVEAHSINYEITPATGQVKDLMMTRTTGI